jgi:hypothetical protein
VDAVRAVDLPGDDLVAVHESVEFGFALVGARFLGLG